MGEAPCREQLQRLLLEEPGPTQTQKNDGGFRTSSQKGSNQQKKMLQLVKVNRYEYFTHKNNSFYFQHHDTVFGDFFERYCPK